MPRLKETDAFLDDWKSLWKPDLDAFGGYNGATSNPTRIDPKVLEWAKHNCSQKPHFIKVINNNAANNRHVRKYSSRNSVKLTVPTPFAKERFRELNRVVTLDNEEGKTWKVSFGEINAHPCWQQGWRRLAVDYDLKPGDVIVSILVGNSHFHFTRFDEDGNILREENATRSPLNDIPAVEKNFTATHSASQSYEKPGSVTNPEDESRWRASWKSKRAAAVAPRNDHSAEAECGTQHSGLGFDGHGFGAPSQLLAPAHKQMAEAPCKRRRLRRVKEIVSKANSNIELNLAINNEHSHDFEEAGSTSMADSPPTVTTVSELPIHHRTSTCKEIPDFIMISREWDDPTEKFHFQNFMYSRQNDNLW